MGISDKEYREKKGIMGNLERTEVVSIFPLEGDWKSEKGLGASSRIRNWIQTTKEDRRRGYQKAPRQLMEKKRAIVKRMEGKLMHMGFREGERSALMTSPSVTGESRSGESIRKKVISQILWGGRRKIT